MKLLGLLLALLGVVPIVHLACAQVTGGGERLRGLQTTNNVVIDIMVVYSDKSWPDLDREYKGSTYTQDFIREQVKESNSAMWRSRIGLTIELVYMAPLPHEQATTDSKQELDTLTASQAVSAMRNEHRADLVMMTGSLTDACGTTWFNSGGGNPNHGFLVVDPRTDCASKLIFAHELGHALGCDHNKRSTDYDNGYGHGLVRCGGDDPYHTIMATPKGAGCYDSVLVKYFSNPDIELKGKSAGDAKNADCARAIRDNMVAVSEFRE